KHQRWCDKFSQLKVNIIYQPGKANKIADALFRITLKENLIVNTTVSDGNDNNNKDENNSNINKKSIEELLMERFIDHAKWVKQAASKMLGTINYWKSRRLAQQSMNNKINYKIGDKVKIRNQQRNKLEPYFIGPFIIREISWNTAKLQDELTGQYLERNVHFKNILPF
ncbi:hypothetical protein BCR36DRAFT_249145, partial [Piromyces finnis]